MVFHIKNSREIGRFVFSLSALLFVTTLPLYNGFAQSAPEEFPRFIVPRQQKRFDSLREMFWLHYHGCKPQPTLWDEWMVSPALWPHFSEEEGDPRFRQKWKRSLETRFVDDLGYVSSHQHASIAHPHGWPFPAWIHGKGGAGWHFSFKQTAPPPFRHDEISTSALWTLDGVRDMGLDAFGWNLILDKLNASVMTPACEIDSYQAPFLQLRWRASGLGNAQTCVEWSVKDNPEFSPDRRMYFDPAHDSKTAFTLIPVYKHPQWKGTITRLRLCFANQVTDIPVDIQAFFTTYDTRHNVNNQSYLSGCVMYFWWTRDLDFLRRNINKMRLALRHIMTEHNAIREKAVQTGWWGHDGRSGLQKDSLGGKIINYGAGIGNNYWDLIPFGGTDAYAAIRYYSVLNKMATLEREIRRRPEWNIPEGPLTLSPEELSLHAQEVKEEGNRIFWNPATMRFVACVDSNGEKHDYGFTFLNLEAIHYDFASPERAKDIMDWICGDRFVANDDSRGEDIYHWRFAPRATTLRNTEYYYWAWHSPETIPWGGQVQDGGAVLGFSYHDLMARLKTRGAENAWNRLKEIIDWFDEVQESGGYRAYYDGEREGTLQGGGTAGGLGLDHEFTESVLVPQIILEGFMGFSPRGDGFNINPQFPSEWGEIAIDNISFHGVVLDLKASENSIKITRKGDYPEPMNIGLPKGEWRVFYITPYGRATRSRVFNTSETDGAIEVVWENATSVIFIRERR